VTRPVFVAGVRGLDVLAEVLRVVVVFLVVAFLVVGLRVVVVVGGLMMVGARTRGREEPVAWRVTAMVWEALVVGVV